MIELVVEGVDSRPEDTRLIAVVIPVRTTRVSGSRYTI
jgi:hypothetical protein